MEPHRHLPPGQLALEVQLAWAAAAVRAVGVSALPWPQPVAVLALVAADGALVATGLATNKVAEASKAAEEQEVVVAQQVGSGPPVRHPCHTCQLC